MASHQILNVLIPGSIVIILKQLTKDNVQQSEDFTNTKTSMEIDAKKDSELIRIIGVYAPSRERSFVLFNDAWSQNGILASNKSYTRINLLIMFIIIKRF